MPKSAIGNEFKHYTADIIELKLDEESRVIEGYASVFNNVDSYNDIVLPGAFTKSIKKRKPAMLWQHESGQVIGMWDTMEEKPKGLFVKGKLVDTTMGEDAYKLVKMGAVTGMSIGYSAKQYEIDQEKGTRKLMEVDLYEVSLVTFPANERAQITRVKSLDGKFMTEREFEEFLRDAGLLSREDAKVIVSRGYKALMSQRDAGDLEASKTLTNLFNQFKI